MRRGGSDKGAKVHFASPDPLFPRPSVLPIHELGEGRLEPGIPDGRPQKVLRLDVTGAPPNLLGRLLVGSYITGHDQVFVTARRGLTAAQKAEVHRAVDRILGMTVVGDSPDGMEILNFIDPGKYELPRMLHRVVQMLRAELEICHAAVVEKETPQLQVIEEIEEEVDRFYLLMVRQLLLSSESARIARDIDVESHHYQIGDRLVAKALEVTGDLIFGIGSELRDHLPGLRRIPRPLLHELGGRIDRLERLLARSMNAFGHLSMVEANATLNVISESQPKDASLGQRIARLVPDRKIAVAAQRISSNLEMAFEMLVIINEVTINRCVEPETELHPRDLLAAGRHGTPAPPKTSHTSIAILATSPDPSVASTT
jgi:phosphate uptake regulator